MVVVMVVTTAMAIAISMAHATVMPMVTANCRVADVESGVLATFAFLAGLRTKLPSCGFPDSRQGGLHLLLTCTSLLCCIYRRWR